MASRPQGHAAAGALGSFLYVILSRRICRQKEAKDLCFKLGNGKAEACAGVGTYTTGEKIGRRICIIVIASDDLHGTLQQYSRHEIAHCNGWNKSRSN